MPLRRRPVRASGATSRQPCRPPPAPPTARRPTTSPARSRCADDDAILSIRTEYVDDAHGADAHHVREPDARVRVLPHTRFATQLPRDLGNLAHAGRADRMTH